MDKMPTNPYTFLRFLLAGEPSLAECEAFTGLSERQVRRILTQIREAGWRVEKYRDGKIVRFSVSDPDQIKEMHEAPPAVATPGNYAKLCKVDRSSIYGRIASGTLMPELIRLPDGSIQQYINLKAYPPRRFKRGLKPKK